MYLQEDWDGWTRTLNCANGFGVITAGGEMGDAAHIPIRQVRAWRLTDEVDRDERLSAKRGDNMLRGNSNASQPTLIFHELELQPAKGR